MPIYFVLSPTGQGDGDARPAELASQLMQNPQVLAALQDKLGSMVGVSSGYIQRLVNPPVIAIGLQIRVCIGKLFSLFLIQNICCGYSKELSQLDGSFKHPKHMFKLIGKRIIKILHK